MKEKNKCCYGSETNNTVSKTAVIISCILVLLLLGSIAAILLSKTGKEKYVADIYQNSTLIQSIPLYAVEESYSFEIKGTGGCTNVVEVRPGSIAILSADCPDKLCVHQGAVSNSLLPITCLPNRLVIQLRALDEISSPDIITH